MKAAGYYVSAVDGPQFALVAGPFKTHQEALDQVEHEREAWANKDPWSHFAAWGTCLVKPDYQDSDLAKALRQANQKVKP